MKNNSLEIYRVKAGENCTIRPEINIHAFFSIAESYVCFILRYVIKKSINPPNGTLISTIAK